METRGSPDVITRASPILLVVIHNALVSRHWDFESHAKRGQGLSSDLGNSHIDYDRPHNVLARPKADGEKTQHWERRGRGRLQLQKDALHFLPVPPKSENVDTLHKNVDLRKEGRQRLLGRCVDVDYFGLNRNFLANSWRYATLRGTDLGHMCKIPSL